MDEKQMRDSIAPTPKTTEELKTYIDSLVTRDHDYGTCVYAMSLAATAAFNFVAHNLGVTGFQASCADMDVLRRTRGYKGPFMVIDADNLCYPQYDLRENLEKAIDDWMPWAAEQAAAHLAARPVAHPKVLAHWENLVAQYKPTQPE